MPSLVNLSHVCSHLQNASRARLGVTSISFTKTHLAVALVLHRQGFISHVKLAGHTPPRSMFPSTSHSTEARKAATKQSGPKPLVPANLELPHEPLSRHNALNETELNFLLAHYRKSDDELQRFLSELELGVPITHGTKQTTPNVIHDLEHLDKERVFEVTQKYRRLVIEAERLVQEQSQQRAIEGIGAGEGEEEDDATNPATLHAMVARVLQPAEFVYQPKGKPGKLADPMGAQTKSYDTDPDDPNGEGIVTQANRSTRRIWLGLKYYNGEPVLRGAQMLAKPSKRMSLELPDLKSLLQGRSAAQVQPLTRIGEILILYTSAGTMDAREAVEKRLGGIPLCRVW